MRFRPDEPSQRPDQEQLQVEWTNTGLKKVLNKVYKYRSRYLHAGKPFPAPMLQPPDPIGVYPYPPEVPSGLASASHSGIWMQKDTPINLHCFPLHYSRRTAQLVARHTDLTVSTL